MSVRDALEMLETDWDRVAALISPLTEDAIRAFGNAAAHGVDDLPRRGSLVIDALARDLDAGDSVLEAIGAGRTRRAAERRPWADLGIALRARSIDGPRFVGVLSDDRGVATRNALRVHVDRRLGGFSRLTFKDLERLPEDTIVVSAAPDAEVDYSAPRFQFVPGMHSDLIETVVTVNEQLEARSDPWGVLAWWITVNGWLGVTPVSALGEGRNAEIVQASHQVTATIW